MRKALDLRGQTINNLQIIEPISKDRKNSIIWKCKCSCGNICSYSTDHLTRRKNPVKSCGCLCTMREGCQECDPYGKYYTNKWEND